MLDARQLQAFHAVVEYGGFGPAARALSLSLPAVSVRIKTLEDQLGQRLLVRGKQVRATAAGQALMAHVKQVQLLQADVLKDLQAGGAAATDRQGWQSLSVAVNADSVGRWFLPGVSAALQQHRLLLDLTIDDQDHTHEGLKSGAVMGCVTTLAKAMRGCVAEPLGCMGYCAVATRDLLQQCREVSEQASGPVSVHRLLAHPAVIFNRKDALQDAFLARYFGLQQPHYPRHFVPAMDAYEAALALGLGWGMVPEHDLAAHPQWEEVVAGARLEVHLYWQHWAHESLSAQRLTAAVKAAAARYLQPT